MAPLIIVALYGLTIAILWLCARLDMSDEVRLAFNVVGGIGALVIPLIIFGALDLRLTRRVVERISRRYCIDRGVDFVSAEMHKNHFTVVYRASQERKRQKFRVRFVPTTWLVRTVEWL